MGVFLFYIILGVLVYAILKKSFKGNNTNNITANAELDRQLASRNYEWAQFIAGYKSRTQSKVEKALVDRILADITAMGLPIPQEQNVASQATPAYVNQSAGTSISVPAANESGLPAQPQAVPAPDSKQQQLDNISLLLYLGAFLFVASTGLFVTLTEINGSAKTLIVLLTMAVFYSGGMTLYQNRPKFKPAGLTFVAIGMAIAPLIGLAAYNYAFTRTNGSEIWFGTSVLCLALYGHAVLKLKTTLTGYLLVFTFLSMFESAISLVDAPVHYFVWGLALVGLLMRIIGLTYGYRLELQEPASVSSQLLIPLSVFVSFAMLPNQGIGQLAVSCLLAAAYYGLLAVIDADSQRANYTMAAHVFAVVGLSTGTYELTAILSDVAVVLIVLAGLQTVSVVLKAKNTPIWHNFASVTMVMPLVALFLFGGSKYILFASLVTAIVANAAAAWKLRRIDGYAVGGMVWIALPIVTGQIVLNERLPAMEQSVLVLAATAALAGSLLWLYRRGSVTEWLEVGQFLVIAAGSTAVITTMFGSHWLTYWIALGVALLFLGIAEIAKKGEWSTVAALTLLVPVVFGLSDLSKPFAIVAVVTALVFCIITALRQRQEIIRWLSTGLWLLAPVVLGNGAIGVYWESKWFAWAFIVVMMVLIVSRMIARGTVLVSSKVPLASYARTASASYVIGYTAAGVIAFLVSLASPDSQLHTSLILVVLGAVAVFAWQVLEKKHEILALVPILAQILLLSMVRPDIGQSSFNVFLMLSTAISAGGYVYCLLQFREKKHSKSVEIFSNTSMLLSYFTPFSFFVVGNTVWPMPVGLMIAGTLTFLAVWRAGSQFERELSGGIITAGFMWLLYYLGVRNVQAYTHILAALFAGYAYWRNIMRDRSSSDSYLLAMLSAATIPLALQALNDTAGGVYGWWLLIEQIGFILLGIAIERKLVIWWGLWVTVAAVLFQLRGLGWAMLAVVALFVIGIGIYKLSKVDARDEHKPD